MATKKIFKKEKKLQKAFKTRLQPPPADYKSKTFLMIPLEDHAIERFKGDSEIPRNQVQPTRFSRKVWKLSFFDRQFFNFNYSRCASFKIRLLHKEEYADEVMEVELERPIEENKEVEQQQSRDCPHLLTSQTQEQLDELGRRPEMSKIDLAVSTVLKKPSNKEEKDTRSEDKADNSAKQGHKAPTVKGLKNSAQIEKNKLDDLNTNAPDPKLLKKFLKSMQTMRLSALETHNHFLVSSQPRVAQMYFYQEVQDHEDRLVREGVLKNAVCTSRAEIERLAIGRELPSAPSAKVTQEL